MAQQDLLAPTQFCPVLPPQAAVVAVAHLGLKQDYLVALVAVVEANLQEPAGLAIHQTQHPTKANPVVMDSVRQAPMLVAVAVALVKSV